MVPELIADRACVIGENPLWHPVEKRLYWVDIPQGRLFRYDPATGRDELCEQGEVIGGFAIQHDGALLLFMARGAVKRWQDGRLLTVIEQVPEESDSRFNDVIADPQGRVFCGTMSAPSHAGRLYRLDTDRSLTRVLEGVGTSNGMGFTPDGKGMYHTDTRRHEIRLYDYNRRTGELSGGRVFLHTGEGQGRPDGMTVDAEGFVWSAMWEGGCIRRFSPDGREDQRIDLPARKVTCVTFGGDDYADLYVTTAGGDDRSEQGQGAGALFRLRPPVGGVPEFLSRIPTEGT